MRASIKSTLWMVLLDTYLAMVSGKLVSVKYSQRTRSSSEKVGHLSYSFVTYYQRRSTLRLDRYLGTSTSGSRVGLEIRA